MQERIKRRVDLTPGQLCTINANGPGSQLVNHPELVVRRVFAQGGGVKGAGRKDLPRSSRETGLGVR